MTNNTSNAEKLADWHYKRMRDFTIEDALEALDEGFYCICSAGKIAYLTNDPDM